MSAASDIKLLCEAILHFDKDGMRKFNLASADLYKMWTNSFIQGIKQNMPLYIQNAFSEEHAAKIGDAIISALKKVSVDTKNLSEEKVEVTVTGLNVGSIFAEENWQPDVNSDAGKDEIVNSLVRAVEKNFDALQPVNTTVFVVDCGYSEEGKFWAPLSMDNFMPQLFAGTLGNK